MATSSDFYDEANEKLGKIIELEYEKNIDKSDIHIIKGIAKSLSKTILEEKKKVVFLQDEIHRKGRELEDLTRFFLDLGIKEKTVSALSPLLFKTRCEFYQRIEREKTRKQLINEMEANCQSLSRLYEEVKKASNWTPENPNCRCVACENMGGKDIVYVKMRNSVLHKLPDLNRVNHVLEWKVKNGTGLNISCQREETQLWEEVNYLEKQIKALENDCRLPHNFSYRQQLRLISEQLTESLFLGHKFFWYDDDYETDDEFDCDSSDDSDEDEMEEENVNWWLGQMCNLKKGEENNQMKDDDDDDEEEVENEEEEEETETEEENDNEEEEAEENEDEEEVEENENNEEVEENENEEEEAEENEKEEEEEVAEDDDDDDDDNDANDADGCCGDAEVHCSDDSDGYESNDYADFGPDTNDKTVMTLVAAIAGFTKVLTKREEGEDDDEVGADKVDINNL